MKKCIIMLVFFVLMLMLSVLAENSDKVILEDSVVMDERNVEIVLKNKELRN